MSSRHGGPPAFVLGMSEIGLAVTRSLGRAGVAVHAFEHPLPVRPPGFASRYCTRATVCPDPLRDEAALRDLLLRAARLHADRPVLFFTSDPYVDFVRRNRAALAERLRFAFPPEEVGEALLDKRRQLALVEASGVPCPRTFFPETRADVLALRERLAYPAFIKPYQGHLWRARFGAHSKGFRAGGPDELVARFDDVLASGLPAMVQEVVLGPDANVVIYSAYVAADGELLAVHTGRKLRQWPPGFGNTALAESAPEPELAEHALRFLRATRYRGPAGIEMKRDDRDGRLKFIELNARPELFHALPARAGVDLTLVEYRDLAGEPRLPPPAQQDGTRWWHSFDDLQSFLELRRRGELAPAEWVRSWRGARAFAVYAADDPLPLLRWYGARVAKALLRRARRRLAARITHGTPHDGRASAPPPATSPLERTGGRA